jgi:hypothetical protein
VLIYGDCTLAMASGRGGSRRVPDNESSIAYVQMDGLVKNSDI